MHNVFRTRSRISAPAETRRVGGGARDSRHTGRPRGSPGDRAAHLLCISWREAQRSGPSDPLQSHSTPRCGWPWGVVTNHDHDLQRDKRTLAGCPNIQTYGSPTPATYMLTAQGPWMTWSASLQSYIHEDAAPDHQQVWIFKKSLVNIFPQKHKHYLCFPSAPTHSCIRAMWGHLGHLLPSACP